MSFRLLKLSSFYPTAATYADLCTLHAQCTSQRRHITVLSFSLYISFIHPCSVTPRGKTVQLLSFLVIPVILSSTVVLLVGAMQHSGGFLLVELNYFWKKKIKTHTVNNGIFIVVRLWMVIYRGRLRITISKDIIDWIHEFWLHWDVFLNCYGLGLIYRTITNRSCNVIRSTRMFCIL